MDKLFVYNVNGTTFETTEAFGQEWKAAKQMAMEEHTIITRQVICGDEITNEFFAQGGIFMKEKFLGELKPYIF